jgi:hypothetical protein
MQGLNFGKDAYGYHNHIQNLQGAKVRIIPGIEYLRPRHSYSVPYSSTEQTVSSFMHSSTEQQESNGFDDFFKQKVEHSQDRVDLILGEIRSRKRLKCDNIGRLYYDLLRIDQFRAEIPFPQNYQKDNTWSSLNDQELRLREQIRRELKESAKDLSFTNKDMRESLLEFKLRNAKSHMMKGVGLDAIIGPEGSYKPSESDIYGNQNQT